MLQNFSVIKAIGYFATLVMVILFFGSTFINLTNAIREGDREGMLTHSGGRLLSLDSTLNEQTDALLEETAKPKDDIDVKRVTLDLAYGFSTLFVYFLIFYFIFLLLNWFGGAKSLSFSYDLLMVVIILGFFFFLEYMYSTVVLGQPVYPLEGVYRFVTNMPDILRGLFT